jgi:hypothetical protein
MGNQMFQYAIGRALSIRLNRPLVLDLSRLRLEPEYGFDLRYFRLGRQHVRDRRGLARRVSRNVVRLLAAHGIEVMRFVDESSLQFSADVVEIRTPCVLDGYWQSERYFESFGGQLREEFTIVADQDPRSAACEAKIRGVRSIGLHVRRGDYVATPESHAFHGTCPMEYYDAALELVLSRIGPEAELFVFSDDIEWARANIRYALPTTHVDWNAARSYEDLRLMSACGALIMANSTFSWWGGWLNPRSDKVVVAPRQWFRAPGVVSDLPQSPWLIAI